MADKVIPRLKQLYKDKYAAELQKELELKNIHEVPQVEKIVVASGIGKNKDDKAYWGVVRNTITKITGQAPIERMAKKSIATFKIRKGMNKVGLSVTLRGDKMYEFLDRFIHVALPRTRDFHGVKRNAFDGQGNYSFGVIEQSIFPELTFEDTSVLHGLQITIAIKNGSKAGSQKLLEKFGLPFEKEKGAK
ncbi:MAG: 50S ribosomal protein L5 [Candidatus Nomurabacteria bacterium]|jgi:large subunit ribosomal protein L5|nr:50S ribosomal protein L5 [Candidatus Nomurabacteria bacterium]